MSLNPDPTPGTIIFRHAYKARAAREIVNELQTLLQQLANLLADECDGEDDGNVDEGDDNDVT